MELSEMKGLVDGINTGVTALRSEVDELKAGQKDVITQEKWDRMSDDITAKMAAMQDAVTAMEAKAKRPQTAEELEAEVEAKHALEFANFLRGEAEVAGKSFDEKSTIEVKAMSTDVAPDGGYVARPQFVDKVVGRVFETSPLRGLADVITAGAKSIELLIDDDEADVNRVSEGSASSDTDTPELGNKVITAHRYDAEPRITTELLEDSIFDIEGWLQGKVARKVARQENSDFVNGTGNGRARGFLNYAAWSAAGVYEADKLEQINMGSAAALNADGLIDVQASLKEEYQPGATWGMKRATFGKALQLKGSDNYFFSPVLLRDGQATMQLLGKPVVFMDDMPAVAANALSVVYADFNAGYTIYDRSGLTVLRDPFSNHGFMTYYVSKRTGGDVTSYDAIKIGKVAA